MTQEGYEVSHLPQPIALQMLTGISGASALLSLTHPVTRLCLVVQLQIPIFLKPRNTEGAGGGVPPCA